MLLTTPLVVTVGLSLTIPVSLVGQIILQSEYASPLYWFGAAIVFLSFLVVNYESSREENGNGNGNDDADAVVVVEVMDSTGNGNGRSGGGRYERVPVVLDG